MFTSTMIAIASYFLLFFLLSVLIRLIRAIKTNPLISVHVSTEDIISALLRHSAFVNVYFSLKYNCVSI